MRVADDTLEVLKALVVLRRVLRTNPATGDVEPKLPAAQVQVLIHLGQAGPLTMSALARQLGISCPAATDLVDRLVHAERVERVVNAQDRRKVMVQLTPGAQTIAEGVIAGRRERVEGVLEQLPGAERTGFVRGLQLLANTLAASAGVALVNNSWTLQELVSTGLA